MVDFSPIKDDIILKRGDTPDISYTINLKDITGSDIVLDGTWTALFTVDTSPSPSTSDNNLFQLTGTIAADNRVNFKPVEDDTNITPRTYFFDIQLSKGNTKRTVVEGKFRVNQDITKN